MKVRWYPVPLKTTIRYSPFSSVVVALSTSTPGAPVSDDDPATTSALAAGRPRLSVTLPDIVTVGGRTGSLNSSVVSLPAEISTGVAGYVTPGGTDRPWTL